MTTLAFHPLADLFPLIEGADFDALVADIRANGLIEPIVILDGRILDGRNRYRAALAAGLLAHDGGFVPDCDPPGWLETVHGDMASIDADDAGIGDPLAFVISKNLARRHLNESQRAMVAAGIATLNVGRPKAVDGRDTPGHDGAEDIPPIGGFSTEDAARSLNVGPRSVERAKAVREHGTPELNAAVRQGEASVSAAAAIARLPQDEQRRILDDVARSPDTKKAFAGVVKDLRREKQAEKKEKRATREADLGARQRALPDKRYGVILADPEWRFEPWSPETGMDRAPDNHYPTSETIDIVARPVGALAADDCALFLWATAPMLPAALEVMAGWGFAYKTHMIWNKQRPGDQRGTGYWFTGEHELLLLGVKGNPPCPAQGAQWPSALRAPVGAHSAKPAWQYDLIEAYFPNLPKIELNARPPQSPSGSGDPSTVSWPRDGWDAWGLEAPDPDDESPADEPAANHGGDHAVAVEAIRTRQDGAGSAADQAGPAPFADDPLAIPAFLRRTEEKAP